MTQLGIEFIGNYKLNYMENIIFFKLKSKRTEEYMDERFCY